MTQYGTRYSIDFSGMITHKTQDLIIGPGTNTPFVKFSEENKTLTIKGYSSEVDMHRFYYPVLSKLKTHLLENEEFTIFLYFKDLNTSTAKVLFDLFRFVSTKNSTGSSIDVVWSTDSDNVEMIETGKDFDEIYNLRMSFQEH